MIIIKDPQQHDLFDHYQTFLSPVAYDRLTTGYHAVFRHVILSVLPAKKISENFHPVMGRPTKELYSMTGLLLLKEYHDWTNEEAVDAYMFDSRVQYALNLGRDNISFCTRTLERYMKLLKNDELASVIFNTVTSKLVDELGLQIDQQRLDSTHVFSDMATFSRTKLMGVAIKRFLVQLKRHHKCTYAGLPEEFQTRYEKGVNVLFADVSKDKEKRSHLRQDVAEQMHELIQLFSGNEDVESMTTFKQLVTIFNQQCEVVNSITVEDENESNSNDKGDGDSTTRIDKSAEKEVVVRKKTGGNVIQNPSDPDATYDGHKGVGYQVQIAETSNAENEVQLVTSVLPQTAVESDAKAVEPVLNDLENNDLLPERMTADSLYGGDKNIINAAGRGVIIISPVAGTPPKQNPENPTEKQSRLQQRREQQETLEWRAEYNSRAQIEGTIGSVKRRTEMVRLRYRGEESMYASIYLKLAGWNISRAVHCVHIQDKLREIVSKVLGELKSIFRSLCFYKMWCHVVSKRSFEHLRKREILLTSIT